MGVGALEIGLCSKMCSLLIGHQRGRNKGCDQVK